MTAVTSEMLEALEFVLGEEIESYKDPSWFSYLWKSKTNADWLEEWAGDESARNKLGQEIEEYNKKPFWLQAWKWLVDRPNIEKKRSIYYLSQLQETKAQISAAKNKGMAGEQAQAIKKRIEAYSKKISFFSSLRRPLSRVVSYFEVLILPEKASKEKSTGVNPRVLALGSELKLLCQAPITKNLQKEKDFERLTRLQEIVEQLLSSSLRSEGIQEVEKYIDGYKKLYNRLRLKYHPDKNKQKDNALCEGAIKELNGSYKATHECLLNCLENGGKEIAQGAAKTEEEVEHKWNQSVMLFKIQLKMSYKRLNQLLNQFKTESKAKLKEQEIKFERKFQEQGMKLKEQETEFDTKLKTELAKQKKEQKTEFDTKLKKQEKEMEKKFQKMMEEGFRKRGQSASKEEKKQGGEKGLGGNRNTVFGKKQGANRPDSGILLDSMGQSSEESSDTSSVKL